MRAAGEVVDGDPVVVVEVGLVVGGGGLHRVAPARAVVVGARDRDLLAGELLERVGQAAVVDDDAAGEAERAVGAAPRAVVQAGVASRDPANAAETRQEAAAPRLAVIGRAVVGRDWHAGREGAGAGEWDSGAGAEWLLYLVVGPGDQDARERVAGDGRLVLLVLREGQAVVLIHQEVACDRWGVHDGQRTRGLAGSRSSRHREEEDAQNSQECWYAVADSAFPETHGKAPFFAEGGSSLIQDELTPIGSSRAFPPMLNGFTAGDDTRDRPSCSSSRAHSDWPGVPLVAIALASMTNTTGARRIFATSAVLPTSLVLRSPS